MVRPPPPQLEEFMIQKCDVCTLKEGHAFTCPQCSGIHNVCEDCRPSFKCKKRKVSSDGGGDLLVTDLPPVEKSTAVINPTRGLSNSLGPTNPQCLTLLHLHVDQGACTL